MRVMRVMRVRRVRVRRVRVRRVRMMRMMRMVTMTTKELTLCVSDAQLGRMVIMFKEWTAFVMLTWR
jgi:hypothetical protein